MPGSIGQPTQGWLPFQAHKAAVGTWERRNFSDELGMGDIHNNPAAQNDYLDWDVWLDSGTWKVAVVHSKHSGGGIIHVQFDGTDQGTIDTYSAGSTKNNYAEVASITVATAGIKTLRLKAATKNASSSGYNLVFNSVALIKTAGAHSTPAGTDTPGYTWEWIPWMGSKANTGFATRQQASSYLSGGILRSDDKAQNRAVSTDAWLDAGTHTVHAIVYTWTDMGIHNIQLDGAAFTTFDAYSAAGAANVYMSVSGLTIATAGAKTVQDIMATKNASSTNYDGILFSLKFTRTGA